jgi:transposase
MDILAAYREVGSYRAAAAICGTTHKTVRRVVEAYEAGCAGRSQPGRKDRGHNYESVRGLVTERVAKSSARISAKRLLPAARAAGYEGSARNFRRLVAEVKTAWRTGHHRGRRPAVWTPGDALVIDWGAERGLHVFCAVLAWSRVRFVRFAADEKAATTLGLLAECFEVLGGVPRTVLADRMGCLKAGVVAGIHRCWGSVSPACGVCAGPGKCPVTTTGTPSASWVVAVAGRTFAWIPGWLVGPSSGGGKACS